MKKEIVLQNIGEGIEEGIVTEINVQVGDTIEVDTPLIELETDKAILPFPSADQGVVKEIFVTPNQTIKIGQRLLLIETHGNKASASEKTIKKPPKPSTPIPSNSTNFL